MIKKRIVTIQVAEKTLAKMQKLMSEKFNYEIDVNNVSFFDEAIEFIYDSKEKIIFKNDDVRETIQAFNTLIFLKKMELEINKSDDKENVKLDIQGLREYSNMLENILSSYNLSEILELHKLYNASLNNFKMKFLNAGNLIRFENRALPEMFLKLMNSWNEMYSSLSDENLAIVILQKLESAEFRRKAKSNFTFLEMIRLP